MATALELSIQFKELQKRVEALESVKKELDLPEDGGVANRVRELESQLKDISNKYRMLNARISRKNKNGDSSISG